MLLDESNVTLCAQFDHFVEFSGYGHLLQSRAWTQVKTNWDHVFFYQMRNDEIVGTLSLLSVMDPKVKRSFFYVPRGPVCDPKDQETLRALLNEALDYARAHNAFLLRVEPNLHDTEENRALSKALQCPLTTECHLSSQPPFDTVLDLGDRDLETIFNDYSKNMRRHIRSAYRHQVQLYFGKREDLPAFAKMVADMSDRKGITHRSLPYFEQLYDSFSDRIHLSFALLPQEITPEPKTYGTFPSVTPVEQWTDQKALACSMIIPFGDTAYALYGADPIYENLEQSYLLDFEEIRYTYEKGLRYYNMGGIFSTSPENALAQFKMKFTQQGVIKWLGSWEFVLDRDIYCQWTPYHPAVFLECRDQLPCTCPSCAEEEESQ